jgi:hypothetical protein
MTDDALYPPLPPRHAIEAAIEVLIAVRDAMDLDPDVEDSETGGPNIDARGRFDGEWSTEDDEPAGDESDASFAEWTSRGRHKVTCAGHERFDPTGEETEHDDPDTSVEDDPKGIDPEEDFGAEELGEEEHTAVPIYGIDQTQDPVGMTFAGVRRAIW